MVGHDRYLSDRMGRIDHTAYPRVGWMTSGGATAARVVHSHEAASSAAAPATSSRRYLAYLDRMNGHDMFLGTVEGAPADVQQELRARWPTFYSSQRIRLEEVNSSG